MLVNRENVAKIFTAFTVIFQHTLESTETEHQKIATTVPSTSRTEDYGWLGNWPMLREWVGDRAVQALTAHGYSVTNKAFEATVAVDRDDIEDDRIGIYRPMIEMLAQNGKKHPDVLVFNLLKNGVSELCYDGQYFFDDDHPVGDATASNFTDGALTPWYLLDTSKPLKPLIFQSRRKLELISQDDPKVNQEAFMRRRYVYGVDYRGNAGFGLWQLAHRAEVDLTHTNYGTVRAAMMALKADDGEPLDINPNLLVVPPSLEEKARKILMSEKNDDDTTNVWRGTAELMVVRRLAA